MRIFLSLLLLIGGGLSVPQFLVPGWPVEMPTWPGQIPGYPGVHLPPGYPGVQLPGYPGWPGQLPGASDREPDSSEHGGAPGPRQTTCQCGWTNKASTRIVGGSVTEQNEHPFLVAIIDTMTNKQFCGGTIITKRHVLTAAHCTENHIKERRPMHILAGAHHLTGGGPQVIPVARIGQHSQYNGQTIKNDLSVLELSKDIVFSKAVGPVCIQRTPMDMTDKFVKIIGWGNVRHEGPGSPVPKKVTTKVIPTSRCRTSYPDISPTNQICTLSYQKGACMGDSGGPVVWLDPETNRYTLVGAVSFGKICASSDPSVHSNVISYMSWIQGQIGGQGTCEKR